LLDNVGGMQGERAIGQLDRETRSTAGASHSDRWQLNPPGGLERLVEETALALVMVRCSANAIACGPRPFW